MLIEPPKLIFKIFLHRLSLCFLSTLVTISKFHKKQIVSLVGNRANIEVIFNGVDISSYQPAIERPDTFTFIEVGTLCKRKGQLDLVNAFCGLIRSGYDARLLLIGDGPIRDEIVAIIDNNKCSEYVTMAGNVQSTEVFHYLSCSNVFVLPSYSEGLPLSILEAMACQLPVISTRIAGIPELVTPDVNGKLMEPGDIDALMRHMAFFLEHQDIALSFGEAGRNMVKEHFSMHSHILSWMNLIQNVKQ